MKTFLCCLTLCLLPAVSRGQPPSRDLAPDTLEGALAAAACLGAAPAAACSQRALAAGQPGGIRVGRQFTVLLIDGRILARTCAASGTGQLRAAGVLHRRGVAMSVVGLEQNCGRGWVTVDLPHTGTLVDGALGGDE